MKKLQKTGPFIRGLAAGAAILACVTAAQAHPYASGISNNAGTISFILNESAGSVSIALTNNGTGQSTTVAGSTSRGVQTFSLTQSSVTYSNFAITVQKNGTGVFASNGPDFEADLFGAPRALAVNMNPKTHNFGRVYIVNANPTASGVAAGLGDPTLVSRTPGKGVFVLNADGSDANGYGTTAYPLPASWPANATNSSGTGWGSSSTTGPFKVFVGPDDMVYVGDATSCTTTLTCGGTVWIMDPDLLTPTPLLPFIGGPSSSTAVTPYNNAGPDTSRPFVTGSLAQGNLVLYCTMFNYAGSGAINDIFQYNITNTSTATLPYTNAESAVLPGLGNLGWGGVDVVFPDIYLGPHSGEWYESLDRSSPNGRNGWLFDSTGNTLLWDSQENLPGDPNSAVDPLLTAFSVAISPDEKFAAFVTSPGYIIVMNITNNGTIWAPDLSTIVTNNTGLGGSARGLAFDAADNIWFNTGGDDVVRSYTLGLTSTCITSNDYTTANGSFSFSTPSAQVTVTADTNSAYKNQLMSTGSGNNGPAAGDFLLTRTGDTSQALTVSYHISGTATNVTDYTLTPNSVSTVVIPAGSATTNISVMPVHNGVPEPTTTVILTVVGTVSYGTAAPGNTATVNISDDNPNVIIVGPSLAYGTHFNSQYEPNPYDYSTFPIARLGNTNTNAYTVSITYSGTASGSDYVPSNSITVNPGDSGELVTNFSGGRIVASASNSVIATVVANTGYTVGAPASGTNWITYDEPPQGKVLFSDTFESSSITGGSSNYNVLYGSDDTSTFPNNYVVTVPYDYSMLGIPPAPHTTNGSTQGIYIQADNPNNGSAAGVNLYPVLSSFPGVSVSKFGGAYSMRADMFLLENGGTAIAGTTEYAMFGINHSGLDTNWFDNSASVTAGWQYDGLFYDVEADGASLGDYVLLSAPAQTTFNDPTNYGSAAAINLTNIFKANPYTTGVGYGGAPANQNTNGSNPNFTGLTPSWATVEVDQVGSNITMKINNVLIIAYTNNQAGTKVFTNGNIMIGYDDAYNGNGSAGAAVIYDNLSVTQLAIKITSIQAVGSNIQITFTWGLDEPASVFALQSSTSGVTPLTDKTATITRTGVGTYSATIAESGNVEFYQVRHK